MVESRRCPRCGQEKPAAFFYLSKHTGYGLTTYCKACIIADVAAQKAKLSPDEITARGRRRAETIKAKRAADPAYDEKVRAQRSAIESRFRASRPAPAPRKRDDPSIHADYMREWRAGNPERAREISREGNRRYKERHPERVRIGMAIRNANSRAKRSGIDGTLRSADWFAVLSAFESRCAFCHTESCILDLEHVVPMSKGGSNKRDNIVPSCRPCNAQKHDRHLSEFCALRHIDEADLRQRIAAVHATIVLPSS